MYPGVWYHLHASSPLSITCKVNLHQPCPYNIVVPLYCNEDVWASMPKNPQAQTPVDHVCLHSTIGATQEPLIIIHVSLSSLPRMWIIRNKTTVFTQLDFNSSLFHTPGKKTLVRDHTKMSQTKRQHTYVQHVTNT